MKWAIDFYGLIGNVVSGAGVEVQTLSYKGLAGYDSNNPFQADPAR